MPKMKTQEQREEAVQADRHREGQARHSVPEPYPDLEDHEAEAEAAQGRTSCPSRTRRP